jgi:ATP synthase protein I
MTQSNALKSAKYQAMIGLIMVVIFTTQSQILAAAYGFFVGMINVALLAYTFKKANKKSAENPETGILVLYLSAVIRFILLAALIILGLSLLKLNALAVVLTFVAMQIGQVFNLKGKQRLTD